MAIVSGLLVIAGVIICWLPTVLYLKQFEGVIGMMVIPITILAILLVGCILGKVDSIAQRRR